MVKLFYSDNDKQPIIDYCEKYIAKNGYVRVGWAVKEAVKGCYFQGDGHAKAFYNSISSKLVNTGKYIREPNTDVQGDWDIRLNPNYKKERFRDRHPFINEIFITIIAAGLSLLVGWLLLQSQNQSQYQLDKRQDSTIQDLRDSLQKIQTLLKDTTSKK